MFSFGIFSTHIPYMVMIFFFALSILFPSESAVGKAKPAKSQLVAANFFVENSDIGLNCEIDFDSPDAGEIHNPFKFLISEFSSREKYLFRLAEMHILQESARPAFERPPPTSSCKG